MLVPLVEKGPSSTGPNRPSAAKLAPLETEIIDFIVQVSRVIGQLRSLAEIYGSLFISGRLLAMDDLIERLRFSEGSASQGFKFSCSIGAARTVYVPRERRTHYEAVAQLRDLTTRFLRGELVPHLDNGLARLERIADIVKRLPLAERSRINSRVKMLLSWQWQSTRFLPLLIRILGK
jgi:DNA-binding transcriptional regulator GbsR (MarR family)